MAIHTCLIDGKRHRESSMKKIADGWICNKYVSSQYLTKCIHCNNLMLKPKDGINRCSECEEKIYTNIINSYGTKPRGVFKNFGIECTKDLGKRYYGLEMEFNNTSNERVHSIGRELYDKKYIYNKSDGSIGGGVEIVTSPCDKRSIKYLLDKMEGTIFDYILKNSGDYKSNAGLHIHVSLKSIDIIDRYKLCMLLNTKQSDKEKYILYYLSNRVTRINDMSSSFRYCEIGMSNRLKSNLTGHSVALNTANKHTYEFRIFKTSAHKETLLSYIEIVDKMIEFCHTHGAKDIRVSNFIMWLKDNTDNKLILDKIKKYEKYHGKFTEQSSIYTVSDVLKQLHNIKWTEYEKLLTFMQGARNNREISLAIKRYKDGLSPCYSGELPKSSVCDSLQNTIKKCTINLILKEIDKQKGKRKCA